MMRRLIEALGVATVIVAVGVLLKVTPAVAAGQAASRAQAGAAAKTGAAPKTPWGDPDLQGTWDNTSQTPLERPAKYAGRAELTDAEVAELEKAAAAADRQAGRPPRPGDTGFYSTRVWGDRGTLSRQTSLVIDPPDGKLPPLTPEGQAARKAKLRGGQFRDEGFASWEDLHLWERCLSKGGLPNNMLPRGYNNNTQIVQTPGYVALLHEMIHEVRIIPLDRRPHLPENVRQWMGDGRGHWEGDTLVVDTTNIVDAVSSLQPWADYTSHSDQGSGRKMHLVERFQRVAPNMINYRVTVEDPLMYTKPYTVAMPMMLNPEPVYEYACHEANYTMPAVLEGERLREKAEEEAIKSGKPLPKRTAPSGQVAPPE